MSQENTLALVAIGREDLAELKNRSAKAIFIVALTTLSVILSMRAPVRDSSSALDPGPGWPEARLRAAAT